MPCSSFQQFIRVNSVIAKKLGCHLKVAKRRCKAPYAVGKSACCTLPSDRWLKIQPTIANFQPVNLPAAGTYSTGHGYCSITRA